MCIVDALPEEKKTLGNSRRDQNGTYEFPDIVDVEYESLENEKVDGVSGVSPPNGNEQGAGTDGVLVSFRATRKDWNTDAIRNVTIPITAGNLSKLRPNSAIA